MENAVPPPTVVKELETAACVDNTLVAGLLAQLECPVCYEVKGPPIFMCRNGHNVCHFCKEQVMTNECATCRTPGRPSFRNRFAEQTYDRLTVPCAHEARGCCQRTLPGQHLAHALECPHAPVSCALCRRSGTLVDIVAHLRHAHTEIDIVHLGNESLRRTAVLSANFERKLALTHAGKLFWLSERYDVETETFATRMFTDGPEVLLASDYICTLRFVAASSEEEVTASHAVALASDFTQRTERSFAGNALKVLSADGILRYNLTLIHKRLRVGEELALAALWVSPGQWLVTGQWEATGQWDGTGQWDAPGQWDADPWMANLPGLADEPEIDMGPGDWPGPEEILGPWDVPGAWVDFDAEEPVAAAAATTAAAATPAPSMGARALTFLAGSYPLVVGCGLIYTMTMH